MFREDKGERHNLQNVPTTDNLVGTNNKHLPNRISSKKTTDKWKVVFQSFSAFHRQISQCNCELQLLNKYKTN